MTEDPEKPSIYGLLAVIVIFILCAVLWKKNHSISSQKVEVGTSIHATK